MSIFKEGDEAYYYDFEAKECKKTTLLMLDRCDGGVWLTSEIYNTNRAYSFQTKLIKENALSFTPYDPVNGGFSNKRQNPKIEDYQLIWVRNEGDSLWQIKPFRSFLCHMNDNAIAAYEGGKFQSWKYYSITCPYDLDQPCFKK